MVRAALTCLIIVLAARDASAAPRMAGIFANHMVVQRDQLLPVWGWADAGENVTVSFAGQEATAVAAGDGSWEVTLGALGATSIGQSLRVMSEHGEILLEDVLVGDVWHASGQSNMAMTVAESLAGLPAVGPLVATAHLPTIRFCRIGERQSRVTQKDLRSPAQWTVCSPETAGGFSAAAFFFASTLERETGIPIGVIDSSRGGTPIEPFIPYEAFTGHPTLERERELGDVNDLEAIWRMPGGVRARDGSWLPGRLFHSRLAPLQRFPVCGCLWYQGESNCGVQEDPRDYAIKMRALVRGWRTAFGRETLPFFYVQLPGSGAGPGWPYLREQQRLVSDEPLVGMAVTVDLAGEGIHPPNKVDVGRRLAAWALAEVYQKPVAKSGPLFHRQELRDSSLVLHFRFAESGLMVARKVGLAAPQTTPGEPLLGFEVADEHGAWHPATAVIEGATVVVASESVLKPMAARYAYAIAPAPCTLYSADGLPASPFCSIPELLAYDPSLPE
jgi:sialate O-acetylesterase